jgi:hypothetical protein
MPTTAPSQCRNTGELGAQSMATFSLQPCVVFTQFDEEDALFVCSVCSNLTINFAVKHTRCATATKIGWTCSRSQKNTNQNTSFGTLRGSKHVVWNSSRLQTRRLELFTALNTSFGTLRGSKHVVWNSSRLLGPRRRPSSPRTWWRRSTARWLATAGVVTTATSSRTRQYGMNSPV